MGLTSNTAIVAHKMTSAPLGINERKSELKHTYSLELKYFFFRTKICYYCFLKTNYSLKL